MKNKNVSIAISTIFQDAGDATKAIEIAKGLKKYQPDDINARIIFISHGSRFEKEERNCHNLEQNKTNRLNIAQI